ncbi:MAG: T9SS type A sorting domain-containing protein [Prevotellaceae bacterium]|nr:T9SS type A sorting domain-containing protein [Prevotellaceae bacterium]
MKKTLLCLRLLMLLVTVIWVTPSLAQISIGGTPPSFRYETGHETLRSAISLPIDFDVVAMRTEDVQREAAGMPPRVGKIIPVNNLTTENSGEWTTLPNGQHIWRLSIAARDAIAIMLTYDKFDIPTDGQLFIYNDDRSRVLGAYTDANNPKKAEYATEFVSGDRIILEYVAPIGGSFNTPIVITGVVYGYNYLYSERSNTDSPPRIQFGPSGSCMVNVICPEGDDWLDQKEGVVRIVTPVGGGYYALCSGSLINNTAYNFDPLFLSAWHCYEDLTSSQINQTIYYFKYEHHSCSGRSDPSVPTITGATSLTDIPLDGGSDGQLLRLNEGTPQWFMDNGIYFNGWDRRNVPATSGVGIHHPNADVKKISTFTATAVSANGNFGAGGTTAPNSGWRVIFVATQSGHGVTEGGSSGSPLFDQNKRVVGTLSGGNSSCTNLSGTNLYGKLWYHWDQSANNTEWMKPYLDPIDSGEEYIDGTYASTDDRIPIVVTADNKQMQESETVPALTTTITGQPQGTHTYADIVSSTLTTVANSMSPAGTYTIVVNSENLMPADYLITDVNGILTITAYPTIITQQPTPTESFVCAGGSHTFMAEGTGLELKYQWQKHLNDNYWQDIAGANASSYTINDITINDAGIYRVKLTSRSSEAISEGASLTVGVDPSNLLVFEWDDVPTINCNSTTNGGYTFVAFQWYKNGTVIQGATKPYIQIEPGATYDCEMKTSNGEIFRFCNHIAYASKMALFVVYPNPASIGENVTVQLANAPKGSVVNIFDLNGGLIKGNIPMYNSEAIVNVSGMKTGMYVMQVVSPDGIKRTTNIVVK